MLNVARGAIVPEFQAPVSDVVVWLMLSLFVQVTVVPLCTVTGLGLNAVVVSELDPETMEIDMAFGDGDMDMAELEL